MSWIALYLFGRITPRKPNDRGIAGQPEYARAAPVKDRLAASNFLVEKDDCHKRKGDEEQYTEDDPGLLRDRKIREGALANCHNSGNDNG